MPKQLYISADNNIELNGLRNTYTGAYINDATVTCSMFDGAGGVVVTDVNASYQSGTDGDYLGVIQGADVAALVAGMMYYVEITISIDGVTDFRRIARRAAYRRVE